MQITKLSITLTALSCAVPLPKNFDVNPVPANDYVWIPAGMALDGLQQVAKFPWYIRAPIDVTAAVGARFPKWGKHHIIDSGFDIVYGAGIAEIGGGIIRAVTKKHPDCQYAGMDGKVHRGKLYGEECK